MSVETTSQKELIESLGETPTLSELIEIRGAMQVEISGLERELKAKKARRDIIDGMLMKELSRAGVKRTATESYSVSIKEDTLPEVVDWDALYEHIKETGDFSLLHRRTSSPAYREILSAGQQVPGIQPRTHRTINFRSI